MSRLEPFFRKKLAQALLEKPPISTVESPLEGNSLRILAFYEAYFSNFIEGTEFEIKEAFDIVFNGRIPQERPQDAHDVLGTFLITSNIEEMSKVPKKFDKFVSLLRERHRTIMKRRPDKYPGEFKVAGNRAGNTIFVAPDLVMGTLQKGFELYQTINTPLHRAIFIKFLVAEVHPFADGNGRVARIMMNAELVSANEQRIIIPTVYRNNYLSALKALSLNKIPELLIRTLDFAQKYVNSIDWSDFQNTTKQLERTNAFMDPYEAEEQGIRLMLL